MAQISGSGINSRLAAAQIFLFQMYRLMIIVTERVSEWEGLDEGSESHNSASIHGCVTPYRFNDSPVEVELHLHSGFSLRGCDMHRASGGLPSGGE